MTKNLTSGRGMSLVPESVVLKEPRPDFTASWHPFSHGEIITAMERATESHKLEIVNREYSIRENSKMLAAWEIKRGTSEFHFGIGFRNSIDKTHSVAVFLFLKIFTCANWNFSSFKDWVLFRKHTGRLEMNEVAFYANEAIDRILPKMDIFAERFENRKNVSLSMRNASLLCVGAMERKLIPPQKFPEFWGFYQGPESKYAKYADSLYAWHNAATETMKTNSLLTQSWNQDRLNHYVDYEVPMILESADKPKTIRIDFQTISKVALETQKKEKGAIKEELKGVAKEVREKFKETTKKTNGDATVETQTKKKKKDASSIETEKIVAPDASHASEKTSDAKTLTKKRADMKDALTDAQKSGKGVKKIETEIRKIDKTIKKTEKEKKSAVRKEKARRKEVAKTSKLIPVKTKKLKTLEELDAEEEMKPGEMIVVKK